MPKATDSSPRKAHIIEIAVLTVTFLAILVACLVSAFMPKGKASRADIVRKGELVASLRLDHEERIILPTDHGEMVIDVRVGEIAVLSSPCPAQYCVSQAYKSQVGESIICAHEGVTIYLLGDVVEEITI